MKQIQTTRDGAVLIGRISNPPHGLMNDETAEELTSLLDLVENDEDIRVTVLTGGQPDVFIRHYDVAILERRGRELAAKGFTFDPSRPIPESSFLEVLRRIETMPKLFVAAINGTAMGGGFELALACDIRLAKDGPYDLGLPEINIGLLPGAGGTQRLPRLIGEGKALELMLTGTTFSPKEAEEMGAISKALNGDVLEAALEMAHQLSGKHARAAAHIKRLVRGSTLRPIDDGLAAERTLFCDLLVDEDSIEQMADLNEGTIEISNNEGSV